MKLILTIILYSIYVFVCYQLTHFSSDYPNDISTSYYDSLANF